MIKKENIGEKMIEYRARHNLTQFEMSKKCKVCLQSISNIERGIQKPSRLTFAKILQVIEGE